MHNAVRSLVAAVAGAATVFALSVPAQAAVTPGKYVALGDSYAAGVGAFPYDPSSGDCRRSPDSYPRTWAKNHPDSTLIDMTCNGATIADVRAHQLSALSADTTLVTITIGGNDDGFTNTATACLTGTDEDCRFATDLGAYYARNGLPGELASLYADVKNRAPRARIIVLGYPRIIDSGTGGCGAITPNEFRRNQLNFNADHLAEGIKTAAEQAGLTFVDMRLPFAGHEACSSEPWINGVDAGHITEIFHPNRYGHSVVYTFMLQVETDLR
ncbi:SGNH/GDSL hydrolase family protein [Actinoplanes sp. NPDC049548]|uniref:SGNH/GDSL hydrolase family protein n=1 Tax=Actinoplanes sp. NPDC049548 TaxID=3155152 RepID=UPI00342CF589